MDRREEYGSRRGARRYNKQESAIRQIRVGNSKKRARKTHRTRGREHRKIERTMESVQICRRHDALLVCPRVPDKPPTARKLVCYQGRGKPSTHAWSESSKTSNCIPAVRASSPSPEASNEYLACAGRPTSPLAPSASDGVSART